MILTRSSSCGVAVVLLLSSVFQLTTNCTPAVGDECSDVATHPGGNHHQPDNLRSTNSDEFDCRNSRELNTARDGLGRLLIVRRLADLHTLQDGRFESCCRVGQRTQLRVIPCSAQARSGGAHAAKHVYVRVISSEPEIRGWIRVDDTTDPESLRRRVRKAGRTGTEINQSQKLRIPAVIRLQPPEIQSSWRELTQLIDAETTAEPSSRIPDAYLARAVLNALIGNHHDALADYLRAGDIITAGDFDPGRWSGYLQDLQSGLKEYNRHPAPAHVGQALDHWRVGLQSYISADYEASLREFDDAIGLNPERPLYWYYRALTLRQIGADEEAARDARLGVYYEQKLRSEYGHRWVLELPQRLERIQGRSRQWLNDFRRGNTDVWLQRLDT